MADTNTKLSKLESRVSDLEKKMVVLVESQAFVKEDISEIKGGVKELMSRFDLSYRETSGMLNQTILPYVQGVEKSLSAKIDEESNKIYEWSRNNFATKRIEHTIDKVNWVIVGAVILALLSLIIINR